MESNIKRSGFGAWYDKLKGSQKLQIKEIIMEQSGVNRQTVNNYITGRVDVVKNLPPAVKNIIVASFPDSYNVLFSSDKIKSVAA